MKLNELKREEIYYSESNSKYSKDSIFVFKFDKTENSNTFIKTLGILRTRDKRFDYCGLNDGHYHNLRLATEIERIWLEQCKKAGKFINKEEALELLEKDFVLPKKWCVKIKEEYKEDLNKYLHSNSNKYPGYRYLWSLSAADETHFFYSEEIPSSGGNCAAEYYSEFEEITFEQFKKYTLMEMENRYDKWYYNPTSKWLMYITYKNGAYGFNATGEWIFYPDGIWSDEAFEHLASNQLVKKRLLEYAKKKYPIGTSFECLHECNGNPIIYEDYHITDKTDCIRANGRTGCIYDNGKWARIIKTITFEDDLVLIDYKTIFDEKEFHSPDIKAFTFEIEIEKDLDFISPKI